MTFDQRTIEIAALRRATHPGQGTHYGDPMTVQSIGVAGELTFSGWFDIDYDVAEHTEHPEGDGGIDFTVYLTKHRYPLTIDVKTAREPHYMFIKEGDIWRGAQVLVQCGWDDAKGVYFVGWEWRSAMKLAKVRDFGYGPNYHIHHTKLRPWAELCALMALRDLAGPQ